MGDAARYWSSTLRQANNITRTPVLQSTLEFGSSVMINRRRPSSASRAWHFAVAVLVLPFLAATALGQTLGGKQDGKAKSDYLNEGVYRIIIYKYLYHPTIPTEDYYATGLLVREPNLVITTRISDKRGEELYTDPDLLDFRSRLTGTRLVVCEQEPDPVRLAAQRKDTED